MKILLDTCVILDYIEQRDDYAENANDILHLF